MSSTPTEPAPPPPRRRRLPWRITRHRENRSIEIGILGTIIAHLLLLWIAPKFESNFMSGAAQLLTPGEVSAPNTFDIQLMPEQLPEPDPPPPQQFVEVNPDAPDNPPDETDNFGALNQQMAQETPAPEDSGDMPATEGQDDIQSTAIVSGTRSPPTPTVAAPPPEPQPPTEAEPTEATEPAASPQLALDPLAGFEQIEGDNPDGIGSNIAEEPENPQADVDEQIEGVRDPAEARPEGRGLYYRPDPNRPQQRPMLAQAQIRPTIMANRVDGTSNMGVRAHNALKTIYGEYLNRVIEVVDQEWTRNIRERIERRFALPVTGSRVEVTFVLDKEGKITIGKVDGNAGQLWNGVAVEAIAAPARYSEGYGKWSDEMITVLGDKQEMVFTFFY